MNILKDHHQIIVTRPLQISEAASNYDVKCSVKGGGLSGQAGAIILGISKALISHDENLKKNLKKINLPRETQEWLNEKNTVIGKLEEASNFLKDNHLNLTIFKWSDIRHYMSINNKIKVAVIGATGYTGLDLTLMLSKHPRVKIVYLCATKNLGKEIFYFDKRIKKKLPKISSIKTMNWKELDLIFLSLPNGEAQKLIKKKFSINKKLRFIDLSADFRITDQKFIINIIILNIKLKNS